LGESPNRSQLLKNNDLLWAGRSGDPLPVGESSSPHVQTDLVAHPVSCTANTGPLSRGVKRPARKTFNPTPSSAEV